MRRQSNDPHNDPAFATGSEMPCAQTGLHTGDSDIAAGAPGEDFDAGAWAVLVDEQRRLIAQAAGVHPSRVRIRVGH